MSRKLLLSVKYRINSNNSDKHIKQCDVVRCHLTKECTGVSFVYMSCSDIKLIDMPIFIICNYTIFYTY